MSAKLTIEQIQQRIDRSPANRWLGITVLDLEDAGITMQMPVRADIIGNPDTRVLHGGFMGCLIDTACSFAIIAQTGESVATIDFRMDFHQVQRSPLLFARASVLRVGRRIASTEGSGDRGRRQARGERKGRLCEHALRTPCAPRRKRQALALMRRSP